MFFALDDSSKVYKNVIMRKDILDKFVAFIADNFMIRQEEIPLDSSLVDAGIIDSFGLLEIASFLEREYGIKLNEEQMTKENFGSVNLIVDFIIKSI